MAERTRAGRVELSNLEKELFPAAGFTKGDLIDYYDRMAAVMIRHTKHRGVSMERFPDGLAGTSFFQKDTPDHFPDWIDTVRIPKRRGGSYRAPIVRSRSALLYLANQAVLTPHLYLCRVDDLEHPDRMIFDLDPPETKNDFAAVRHAATALREVLAEVDLEPWVETTGSRGYHLVVPLARDAAFDEVRRFARDVARVLVRQDRERYTLEQRKDRREGRIFVDTLRNAYGATAVAPYAVRARPGAPVATPLRWAEIEAGVDPQAFTIDSVVERLDERLDPWRAILRHGRRLDRRRPKLDALLERHELPVRERG